MPQASPAAPHSGPRPHQLRERTGDAARIEVALPRDPRDPYLQDWVRATGSGQICKAQMLSRFACTRVGGLT